MPSLSLSTRTRRLLNYAAITLNCLTAGSIFTFPLFSPPLSRALHLSMSQTTTLASSSILGEYVSAVMWGHLADKRGPGAVSWSAAVLFAGGLGMLGWRYNVSVQMEKDGIALPSGEWLFLSFYYFLAGCATSASYFSSIIASTKSLPARHSGLAIGVPCSIFGLSPLFLSALAPLFTSPSPSPSAKGTLELDPGRWLLFLALMLFVVNAFGGLVLKVLPWDSDKSLESTEEPTERTSLLPSTNGATALATPPSHSMSEFLQQPSFWLFGLTILLSIGPCEMIMASLGGIVESLLGVHILKGAGKATESQALMLRRTHVQIISAANTLARLGAGALSDWLSTHPAPASSAAGDNATGLRSRIRIPRVSRLFFVLLSCFVLLFAFTYTAFGLDYPSGLWILSISTGVSYGTIFTLAPAIVRTVYPVENFGRNWGIISWFSALGALIFTPLFGLLTDRAGRHQSTETCYGRVCWRDTFVVCSVSVVVAMAMVGALWRGWWRGKV